MVGLDVTFDKSRENRGRLPIREWGREFWETSRWAAMEMQVGVGPRWV